MGLQIWPPPQKKGAVPCAFGEWFGSSCISGRTRTCRASPGEHTPLGTESGTRCPTHSDQTQWFLSCCFPLTAHQPDEACPVSTRKVGRGRWGKSEMVESKRNKKMGDGVRAERLQLFWVEVQSNSLENVSLWNEMCKIMFKIDTGSKIRMRNKKGKCLKCFETRVSNIHEVNIIKDLKLRRWYRTCCMTSRW